MFSVVSLSPNVLGYDPINVLGYDPFSLLLPPLCPSRFVSFGAGVLLVVVVKKEGGMCGEGLLVFLSFLASFEMKRGLERERGEIGGGVIDKDSRLVQ